MARYPHGNPTYGKTATLRGLLASLMACMALVTGVAWAAPSTMADATFELRTETRCRHMAEAGKDLTLVEEFSPTISLGEGEYDLSVALHPRDDDGKDLGVLRVDGKEVAVTETVVPDTTGGMSAAVTLDATDLEGKTLVAFATLSKDGSVIARSEDIDDEQQAVHLPRVTATLAAQDGTTEAMGEAQTTLAAKVSWSNVRPDAGLRAVVSLVDADTGEPLRDKDGREVASLPVVPQDGDGRMTESGTIDVPVAFDGRAHLGKSVTALARLVHDGKTIASEDKPDGVGTVSLPKVTSTLLGGETGLPLAEASGEATITETVSYEALTPGTTYVMTNELVDAETGDPLANPDGSALEGVSGTREIVPTEASGTIELTHVIDARGSAGSTLAARTTLARKADGTVLATADQAKIRLPRITTVVAGTRSGLPCELADEGAGARVAISYGNLEPGMGYVAWAEAHLTGTDSHGNATDEGILHDADGRDATTAVAFTPEDGDGSVELTLPFDGSGLEGRRVAVLAGVSCAGTDVATSVDLASPSQSLWIPEAATRDLCSAAGIDEIPADAAVQVEATVAYLSLPAGTYTAALELVDPVTGNEVTEGRAGATLETNGDDGSVGLEWTVDTKGLAGRTLSAVTYLTAGDVVVAADYGSETLRVAAMSANLHDADSGTQMTLAQRETRLNGTVTIDGISPGTTHQVRGTLIDAESGKELTDGDGKPVTGSATLTPDASEGSAKITFAFDARKLAGRNLCARYELVRDGMVVATTTTVLSESGTVRLPVLSLEARSEASGDHELPADGRQKAVAKISYANVLPGITYHVAATLVDAETGASVKGGDKAIRAEAEVTPESAGGTMELTLDCGETTELAGRRLAIMAVMELDGRSIAAANDYTTKDQGLYVPSIATTLHATDGSHEIAASKDTRLIDTVTYVNLTPGVEYAIEGELVDASTGKPAIRSVKVESQASPTQGASTGQANNSDETNAKDDFVGKEDATTVWVTDDCAYHLDEHCASAEGVLRRTTLGIAKAAGKTPCTTESGEGPKAMKSSKVSASAKATSSSTTPTTAEEEEVSVTAKATFTPTESSGTIEVEFSFDATGLEGKRLVALETVKRDGHTVAMHRDTGDDAQTVAVTDAANAQGGSAESMGQTGVGGGLLLSIVAGITLAMIGFALLVRYGSPNKSEGDNNEQADDGDTDERR